MGDIVEDGYVIPCLAHGDSQQDVVDLYMTKNLYLYTILHEEHVTTPTGEGFIRDHPDDGVAIWRKLVHHYEKEHHQPATLRKDMLYNMSTSTTTLPVDAEVHRVALYMECHNKIYTDSEDERTNDMMKLRYFEKFIRTMPALKAVKMSLNSSDKIAITTNQTPLTAQARWSSTWRLRSVWMGNKGMLIKSTRRAHLCNGQHSIDKIFNMDLTSTAQVLLTPKDVQGGYETYSTHVDPPNMEMLIADLDASYHEAYAAGAEGEAGHLPHDTWAKMNRNQRTAWIKLGKDFVDAYSLLVPISHLHLVHKVIDIFSLEMEFLPAITAKLPMYHLCTNTPC